MSFHHLEDLLYVLLGTGIAVCCLLSWGQITLRLLQAPRGPIQINHAWIGLAILVSLCSLLQLFIPITWEMSLAIMTIALANAYFYEKAQWKQFGCAVWKHLTQHPLIGITSLLGIFFLSSGALLAPGNYDSGLYHFTTIAWLNQHPITLGLGNLHGRLAFNQSYFPLLALLNAYPIWNKGYSIAGPLLIYLGIASIAFGELKQIRFGTYLQAALLILIASLCADISAPTPDLAISVLQIVIFGELIALLWQRKQKEDLAPVRLISFACLCFLLCSMKLSGIAFGLSAFALLLPTYYHFRKTHPTQFFNLLYLLIAFLLIHMTRSYLLSGTPFYPLALGALSWADWAIPIQTIQSELDWTYSWARSPGYPATEVLGNWNWFRPWLGTLPKSVLISILLTSICLPWCLYLYLRNCKSIHSNRASKQSLVNEGLVFFPLLIATLFWFFTAPDIRFLGVIYQLLAIFSVWLTSAMLKPESIGSSSKISDEHTNAHPWSHRILSGGFLCSMIILAGLQIIRPKIFTGSESLPTTELKTTLTQSGLVIYSPTSGEQCGNATLPCTPYFNPLLKEFRLNNWWLIYSVK